MRKVKFTVFSIIILALIAGYLIAGHESGTPQEQITALIEHGRQSIEKKSLSQAMSCISKNYSDQYGMNYDKLRLMAGSALRSETDYRIGVDLPVVEANGSEADAKTHVTVSTIISGSESQVFSGDVVLHLKREKVRRFLIFPAKAWKVTGMEGVGRVFDFGE